MDVTPKRDLRLLVFAVIAFGTTVLDQISKWFAIAHLTQAFGDEPAKLTFSETMSRFLWSVHPGRGPSISVLDNFWHYRYVENPGAAWGFLSQSMSAWRTPFFLVVSLSAMAFIVVCHRRAAPEQRALRIGLAMVFGGAVGNFIDRVRLGYVIDFIDWHYYDKAAWPTFNVADAAISLGVGVLLLDLFLEPQRK